jgi:hypothetical protein
VSEAKKVVLAALYCIILPAVWNCVHVRLSGNVQILKVLKIYEEKLIVGEVM